MIAVNCYMYCKCFMNRIFAGVMDSRLNVDVVMAFFSRCNAGYRNIGLYLDELYVIVIIFYGLM